MTVCSSVFCCALLALVFGSFIHAKPTPRDRNTKIEIISSPTTADDAQLADWLVTPFEESVRLESLSQAGGCLPGYECLSLTNGLISRRFLVSSSKGVFQTFDIFSHMRNESAIRALSPEVLLTLNDIGFTAGGLTQTSQSAYWNSTELSHGGLEPSDPNTSFAYVSHETTLPVAPFPWTPGLRHSPANTPWPPDGLTLTVTFSCVSCANYALPADLQLLVHYEMYVGVPLMTKWVSLHRGSGEVVSSHRYQNLRGHDYRVHRETWKKGVKTDLPVVIDKISPEFLSTSRPYSPVVFAPYPSNPPHRYVDPSTSLLYVTTDQAHGATVSWTNDKRQPSSPGSSQPTVEATYGLGPGVHLELSDKNSGADFVSFRVILLVSDSIDRERSSLARRRIFRTLAPATLEAPLFFHLTNVTPAGVHAAADQLADVGGWDMIIFSFGSGFHLETDDKTYIAEIASEIAYANSKDLEVGGYDLICLDRGHGGYGGNVGDQWDRVLQGGALGPDACFASGWVDKLNGFVFEFVNSTGMSMFETDGPYGGGTCASEKHAYHKGLDDSVYHQERIQGGMYAQLRQRNVFINQVRRILVLRPQLQPDNYFYFGGSKTGIGYNEEQFNLPRWQDIVVTRATLFDDTYEKIPTMGWSFVPLQDYHGGGAAAAFAPLRSHLVEFEFALAQHLGAGVAACYRGAQIYDDDRSEALAKKWASFWVRYRSLLTHDVLHLRRADGRGVDAFMHIDPQATGPRALVMVFNSQTETTVSTPLRVPLYYAGLSTLALVQREGNSPVKMELARDYSITLNVELPAQSLTWWVVSAV